jgi:hypothetical protein
MDKYKIKDLAERLQKEETTELKNKMLFMWTKQEVINLKEYNELVKLILSGVSQHRELLIDFCTKLELKAKQYSYLIPDEDFIDEYLKDN